MAVAKLDPLGLLAPTALETGSLMWHFGRFIANTHMHEGNLSFVPSSPEVAGLRVAPAYDMLPMLYVPQRGVEVVARNDAAQLPLPGERQNWRAAARAALVFWDGGGGTAHQCGVPTCLRAEPDDAPGGCGAFGRGLRLHRGTVSRSGGAGIRSCKYCCTPCRSWRRGVPWFPEIHSS